MSKLDKIFRDKYHEKDILGRELCKVQRGEIETGKNNLLSLKKEKGRAAAIFKLKENISGPKKNPLDPVILIDPETGFEVMEPEEIKRVSLRYCVKLLTNREPKDQYVDIFRQKECLHWLRMKEYVSQDIDELTLDMFNNTLRSLARKKADKYKFIIKGGQSLMNAIFNTFTSIWRSEKIPPDWHQSELVQLWKGKGMVSDLNNFRHIHIKNDLGKVFSQIVMAQAKDKIVNNMSKFQIATKPGHRSTEHLFFIKSVLELLQSRKEAILFTM